MDTYLDNFLQLIPPSQKAQLLDTLQMERKIADYSPDILEVFKRLDYSKVTRYQEQPEILDSQVYNDLTAGVYTDLNILFNQANVIDMVNYNSHISQKSDLAQLQDELNRIQSKIHTLREQTEATDDAVIKIEDFHNKTRLEPYNEETAYLYVDRNGDQATDEELVNISTEQGICKLPSTIGASDVLLDGNAKRIATETNTNPNLGYPIEHINDGSLDTFWAEFILSKNQRLSSNIMPHEDKPRDRTSALTLMEISHRTPSHILQIIRDATRRIIDRMPTGSMTSIMAFLHKPKRIQRFTDNKDHLKRAIEVCKPDKVIRLDRHPPRSRDALMDALNQIRKEYGVPCIIAIMHSTDLDSRYTPEEIIQRAQQLNIPIFIIGINMDVSEQTICDSIAQGSGGEFFNVTGLGIGGLVPPIVIQNIIDHINNRLANSDTLYPASTDAKWIQYSGDGAYATIEVILPQPKILNSLTLYPFTIYPFSVMDVRIEDDINAEDRYIHRLVGIYSDTKPFLINQPHTIDFKPAVVKRIQIRLRQDNYTLNQYLVRETAVKNDQLWQQILGIYAGEEWLTTEEYIINPSMIQDFIEDYTGWHEYLKQYQAELAKWEANEAQYRIEYAQYQRELEQYNRDLEEYESQISESE